jgi:hypothetical protein
MNKDTRVPTVEPLARSHDLRQVHGAGHKGTGRHRRTARKPRGGLDASVLASLGRGLKDCFDDARRQEMPERIKTLLQRF